MKFVMRRSLSVFLAVAMAFSFVLVPKVALAENFPSQILYESVDPLVSRNYIVLANSNFACAACVLGTDDQLLTAEQKGYLSDPNYCPNFCAVADSFSPWDIASSPDWIPPYMFALLSVGYMMMYGTRYVGAVNYETYSHAKLELVDVLNGNYPDGGSDTPGSIPNTLTFTMDDYVGSEDGLNYGYNPAQPLALSATIDISNYVSSISSQTAEYPYVTFVFWRNGRFQYNYKGTLNVYCSSEAPEIGTSISFSSGVWRQFDTSNITVNAHNDLTIAKPNNNWNNSRGLDWNLNTKPAFLLTNFSGGTPSVPEGNWPDEPETVSPTPPDVPNPSNNTEPTEPSTPGITIDLPEINFTPGVDPTDLTDVTDWLRTINHNIVLINENLDAALNEVLNAFEAVGGGLDDIYNALATHCGHIRDSIDSNIYELEEYLQDLFEWLAEELDFTFTGSDYEGYDDSSVLSYLKRILNALINPSSPNYQPNPIADPSGFFDWLMDLLGGFLSSLVSGLPGVLQDLLTDLSSLTEYFPFSMPWDVYGLLLLFAHDPVTPVFDLPWNFAANHTAQIHIDLSQYDGIMGIVRAVEKVIFAAGLAVFTMKMFKPTDVLGGD